MNRNIACMLISTICMLLVLLGVGFLYFSPQKSAYVPISKPLNSNDLMNPISKIAPTKYQIESKAFKVVQPMNLGGSNQERLIKVVDANDYCYFINEYDNYIYPLLFDSKANQFFYKVNYVDFPDLPKIKYLKVGIKKPLYNVLAEPKSINEQRAWLKLRKNSKKNGSNSSVEGSCSLAPKVNIIAIEYEIENKKYKYQVDEKHNNLLVKKLKYVFE